MIHQTFVDFFYLVKPVVPRRVQVLLRRLLLFSIIKEKRDIWPIDPRTASPPAHWPGWPEGKKFALAIMHDVDTKKGYEKCSQLLQIDIEMGIRTCFNFVPERDYSLSDEFRNTLQDKGFEVGVHDLKHDGKLFKNETIFQKRYGRINHYLQKWDSVGFRPGAMHSNLDWIHLLNIEYDSSTFDTDPFEPKPNDCQKIFPFRVRKNENEPGYIELPYTIPQDFTVFVLMKEQTIDIWKRKLDWIVQQGGMVLLTVHPDYMNFENRPGSFDEYPVALYKEFLRYIKSEYEGQYWHALPREIAHFWKKNIPAA